MATRMVTSCMAASSRLEQEAGPRVHGWEAELVDDVRPEEGRGFLVTRLQEGGGLLMTRRQGGGRRSLIKTLGSLGRERRVANPARATRCRGLAEARISRARAAPHRPHGARSRLPVPAPLPACCRPASAPRRARTSWESHAGT